MDYLKNPDNQGSTVFVKMWLPLVQGVTFKVIYSNKDIPVIV